MNILENRPLVQMRFTLAQVNLGQKERVRFLHLWVGFKLFVDALGCIFKLVFFGGIGDKNHFYIKRPFDQFSINYLRYGRQLL